MIAGEKWRRKIGHAFQWKICYQVAPYDGPNQGAGNGKRNKTETLGDLQSKRGVSGIDRGKHADLSLQFEVHPSQITDWKRQLSERAGEVFGKSSESSPPVDVKATHAKIGPLTLEDDFLESALTKAGLLSAKRSVRW